MATRTLGLSISEAYTTTGEGDKINFSISSGTNTAFGSNTPTSYSVTFNSSYLYADYADSITMQWKLRFKINGSWYDIYTGSQTMSKSDSDFSSSGTLPSTVVSLLQSYPIDKVCIYQNGTRVIKGTSSATGTLTLTYTEATYTRCGAPQTVTVNDSSSMVTITKPEITLKWNGATSGTNNPISGYWIGYDISTNGSTWDTGYEYDGISSTSTSGSVTMNFLSKGTYYRFKVLTIGSVDGYDSESATMSPVVYISSSLPVIFNGIQLTKIIYNGTEISSLVYNGTKLF